MMTGGAVGTFIGSWAYGLVGGYGWRYVFFLGIAPAILLGVIRRRMFEPDRFADVQQRRQAVAAGRATAADDHQFMSFVPLQLFNRENRYNTMVGLLFGWDRFGDLDHQHLAADDPLLVAQKSGADATAAVPLVSHGIMLWSLGGIFGYIAFGFLADSLGRRLTVGLYSAGTIAAGLTLYLGLDAYYPWYPVVCRSSAFSCSGCSRALPSICRNCSRPRSARPRSASAPAAPASSPGLAPWSPGSWSAPSAAASTG